MKTAALLLCVCLSASAAPDPEPRPEGTEYELTPLEVTAPRDTLQVRQLKRARAVGGAGAAAGAGLMGYSVAFAAAGPIGWAAGLLYLGGMTAYISHRRLKGIDDLSPEPFKGEGVDGQASR